MRHFVSSFLLAGLAVGLLGLPALGQAQRPHAEGAKVAPPVHYFSITQASRAEPHVGRAGGAPHAAHFAPMVTAPAQTAAMHGGFAGHHYHHWAGYSPFIYSSSAYFGGYPFAWNGYYTPTFGTYVATVPYYVAPSVNFSVAPRPAPEPRNLDPVDPPEPAAKPKPRVSTADQKTRAGKLLGIGDTNFGKQQYFAAIERYKSAAQFAPDLAEPFFRQGYAMVAVGQYDNAVKAFRRGLKIRSDWAGSPFRLNELYGNGQLAKDEHLENLAKAIEANPLDSNALLALGMTLYFDGQRERASVFFTRVSQLGGNSDQLLDDFLRPRPTGAGAAQPVDDGKIVF
jgi:Tfp pilus assembly protein PilF